MTTTSTPHARRPEAALALALTLTLATTLNLTLAATAAHADVAPPARPTLVAGVEIHAGPSEAVQAWRRAVEAGDGEAIARMNGPRTVAYGVDSAFTHGGKAIAAGHDAMFAKYVAKVDIRDAAWVRQGSLLHSWGLFTLTLTPRGGGEPVRIDGRFSDLAAWTDGGWQYLMDHASVPTP